MVERFKTPWADLLPPLSTTEREALRADIGANGVRVPICVDEDDNVLDGHHRYAIDPDCPALVIPGLTPAEKEAFVYRANFVRRNLSPDERREALTHMKKVAKRLRDEDVVKWTQAEVAKALGVDQATVSRWQPTTDMQTHNGCNRTAADEKPDARVKLNKAAQDEVVLRLDAGESQAQVARDFGVTQQAVSRLANKVRKSRKAKEAVEAAAEKVPDSAQFLHGAFWDVATAIPEGSIQLIFTDPPYFADVVPQYGRLAELAERVLVPGGSLITYLGHRLLPGVLEEFRKAPGLTFYWPLACIHTGQFKRMPRTGQVVTWKPMLWFVKGKERYDTAVLVDDSVKSVPQKSHHAWQQGLEEATYYVGKLTTEGGTVFDPYCGGGTTAVAAKRLGRKVITCDVDANVLESAKRRYAEDGAD